MTNKLENALREHIRYRSEKGKIKLIPLDLYDALSETLPHGLVIELANIILKTKGV